MHLHWERSSNTAGDCHIRSLSWMGRVPDEIPQDEGWKLNRNHYYQEGWLSTANFKGVLGVTYTKSHCGDVSHDPPPRTNYNLRGHRAEVTLVRWNEPYQKLASCDSSGIIFVWIKYEGRWSIELINDRNTPVICFSWSHDGRMALICYQDGFVLVGSVTGQRYWSTLLPPDVNCITSATWTPDDRQVYLGTSQGGLLIMDIEGNTVGQMTLKQGVPVTDLAWNCERFNMEEQQQKENAYRRITNKNDEKPYVLAACFKNGQILLMRSYDDVIPQIIDTGLQNFVVDWTNSGELLAVAGKYREFPCQRNHSFIYLNFIHFYNDQGELIYRVQVPSQKCPVTAMTWGHNDKRLFVATGNQIHVAWISPAIATLQLLCRLKIHNTLSRAKDVEVLPLPCRLQNLIGILFTQTIKSFIPDPLNLRHYVIVPPPTEGTGIRLHCTMIRHGGDDGGNNSGNGGYTLYLEHLGGFLPLLKGKKISKLRPDFVIFDPTLSDENSEDWRFLPGARYIKRKDDLSSLSSSSIPPHQQQQQARDSEIDEDGSVTPRVRRRGRRRRDQSVPRYFGYFGSQDLEYVNVLPERECLAEVISNFWGTKFKLIGHNTELLPCSLGLITYKASLLHLQPRQMRLELIDLRDGNLTDGSMGFQDNDEEVDDDDDGDDEDDDELGTGVKMKDDILTAAVTEKVAPVAPLPSRLSFCVQNTTANPPEASTFEHAVIESASSTTAAASSSSSSASVEPNNDLRRSPTSSSSRHPLLCDGTYPQSVKRTVVAPSSVGQILAGNEVTLVDCQTVTPINDFNHAQLHKFNVNSNAPSTSAEVSPPSLRISISCDNHLSDATPINRWAAKAEEVMTPTTELPPPIPGTERPRLLPVSCSANQLDTIVDILGVPSELLSQRDMNKRLFLLGDKKTQQPRRPRRRPRYPFRSRSCEERDNYECRPECLGRRDGPCVNCSSRDDELNQEIFDIPTPPPEEDESIPSDEILSALSTSSSSSSSSSGNYVPPKSSKRKFDSVRNLLEKARNILIRSKPTSAEEETCPKSPVHIRKFSRVPSSGPPPISISASTTPQPLRKNRSSFSPVRSILNSPMLRRKKDQNVSGTTTTNSSDDEEDVSNRKFSEYQNLEMFQKSRLKQKMRKFQNDSGLLKTTRTPSTTPDCSPFLSRKQPPVVKHKQKKLILYNKSPMWNDFSQVYQLDFGGRVTQESAKNFQIEYKGKQVMQFGRIDSNAYTLDFQYPFTALQAFAVALANVTQRLK